MWTKALGVVVTATVVGLGALSSNGCSSSSSAPDDAGAADGKARLDSGDTGNDGGSCSAADVQSFTPTWRPPALTPGACTTAQMDAFVTACFADGSTAATCSAFRTNAANLACNKCVVTVGTAAKLGVIVVPDLGLPTFNIAGCLALTANDLSASSCGAKEQAIEQCVEAACVDNCPIPTPGPDVTDADVSAAISAFDACENSAAAKGCAAYNTAAACTSDLISDGGPSSVCVVDANDPNHDSILSKNLMQVFCGGTAPVDDGGTDGAPKDAADGG